MDKTRVCTFLAFIGLVAIITGIGATIVNCSDNIPDVYFSTSTGKCTKVHNYNLKHYSCDDLPEIYNFKRSE